MGRYHIVSQSEAPPVRLRQPTGHGDLHDNPLVDIVLKNRGATPDTAHYDLANLLRPFDMKGMPEATEALSRHIMEGKRILIAGDYDCDGATSVANLMLGLPELGALPENVEFIIPRREIGYGLTTELANLALERKPDLIITVDSGISNFDGAQAVMNAGVDLIITDHHLPSEDGIPQATAILNPNQPGCTFPSKSLAGCGVALYLLLGTRTTLREKGWEHAESANLASLLDITAIGTTADMVDLDYNNRVIIEAGLSRINHGLTRPGIRALMDVSGIEQGTLTTEGVSFQLAPRINCIGRLEDMTLSVRCLLSEDENEAAELAVYMNDVNQSRKDIQREMQAEAEEAIESVRADETRKALVAFNPTWHEGVIGLVASKMKERYNRPAVAFSSNQVKGPDGEEWLKGSARSIDAVHIRDVLAKIAADNEGILPRFGGHAMAAGMSIPKSRLKDFADAFDREVSKFVTENHIRGELLSDAHQPEESLITDETARLLGTAAPWGKSFEAPLFTADFEVLEGRVIGRTQEHLSLRLRYPEGNRSFPAVAFFSVRHGVPQIGSRFTASFKMTINSWNDSLQLMLEDVVTDTEAPLLNPDGSPPRDQTAARKAGDLLAQAEPQSAATPAQQQRTLPERRQAPRKAHSVTSLRIGAARPW